MGVERVNGTQLTATVQYATVEFSGNTTIGQLTVEPAQFGVHYTGTAGSLTFETSAVRSMHQRIYPYCSVFFTVFHTDISRHSTQCDRCRTHLPTSI